MKNYFVKKLSGKGLNSDLNKEYIQMPVDSIPLF